MVEERFIFSSFWFLFSGGGAEGVGRIRINVNILNCKSAKGNIGVEWVRCVIFLEKPNSFFFPLLLRYSLASWFEKKTLKFKTFSPLLQSSTNAMLSAIRQKCESQNGCYKKTNHAKFLTPWYAQWVRNVRFSENLVLFVSL